MADAPPGLGIVAAVLGVVLTMGALGGPKEQIGEKVAAAVVGTFLGILLGYRSAGIGDERMRIRQGDEPADRRRTGAAIHPEPRSPRICGD
jgi:hypothetical protein